MKKQDLKFGNVVELRNGTLCLIHPMRNYGCDDTVGTHNKDLDVMLRNLKTGIWETTIFRYNDNLYFNGYYNIHCYDYDIMKVYEDYTCKKLLWERKEITLTEDEKVILRKISKEFKYIVRDEDKYLYVCKNKPYKSNDFWATGNFADFYMFNHLFQFIKWEDEEPYLIEDLLGE